MGECGRKQPGAGTSPRRYPAATISRHSSLLRVLALAALVVGGCRPGGEAAAPPPAPPPISAAPDGWTLTSSAINPANRYAYLGNGYVAFQTGAAGCGTAGPATAFVAGLYIKERLEPLPSP